MDSLAREGYEVFFPRVLSPKPSRSRTDVPLFPGYLFLRCDPDPAVWPSIHQLPGVTGWVRFGGVVPKVPDEVVSGLANRVQTINEGGGLWTRFRAGNQVRVVSGAMDNLAEVVEDSKSAESRVKVLMQFLGRQVTTEVPWHTLRRTQQGASVIGRAGSVRRTRGGGRWVRGFGPRAAPSM